MKDKIFSKITNWYHTGEHDILKVGDRIDYLNEKLYGDYEPSIGPKPSFDNRLEKWIENVQEDSEQKTLFKLVPKIFYIGRKEFETLHRIAYNTNTVRWLIDIFSIKLDDKINESIQCKLKKVWFCPITDSMRINQFYHLNSIQIGDKRPEWRSLKAFGSKEKILNYIKDNKFESVVLLEDFVGSGNQIKESVEFAATNFPEIKFLIIPLILCPNGETIMEELRKKYDNVTIDPVMTLRDNLFVKKNRNENEEFHRQLYDLSKHSNKKMKKEGFKWHFLGFRKIGGLIVLHTNTPNNSLPIIWSNNNWTPLFNRHVR